MDSFLPLGSVVKIKNRLVMIVGYDIDTNDKHFQYAGVLYPEGLSEKNIAGGFNKEDIEELQYIGFMNVEAQLF